MSGVTNHITGVKNFLYDVHDAVCPVGLPDGQQVVTTKCGWVKLDENLVLENIYFVPKMIWKHALMIMALYTKSYVLKPHNKMKLQRERFEPSLKFLVCHNWISCTYFFLVELVVTTAHLANCLPYKPTKVHSAQFSLTRVHLVKLSNKSPIIRLLSPSTLNCEVFNKWASLKRRNNWMI